jgi:integrase
VEVLKELNEAKDRRHERRALTVDEVNRLLRATAAGDENFGMTGYERYLLYRLVLETGLRANEIRSLRRADFDFDMHTVSITAKNAKGKRSDQQHLSPGLSDDLKAFVVTKLPDAKAFGGTFKALTDKTADMIRDDLKAAGIPYEDEAGRVFDFHALRGQCASLLAAAGVSPKTAQQIMRHRDINMTMNTYARVLRGSEAEAVTKLPDFSLPSVEEQRGRKTGTDDRDVISDFLSKSCFTDGAQRTQANKDERGTLTGGSETALVGCYAASGQSPEPKVRGSSPLGDVPVKA